MWEVKMRILPSVLLLHHEIVLAIAGYIPIAPRNVPAYRAPAVLAPRRMENPAIPISATTMLQMPRWRVRSAITPMVMVTKAAAA